MDNLKIGYELMAVSNLVRRKIDSEIYELTHEDKLTGANMQIIGFLALNSEKEIFQKDIEKNFSLRASTVSANLRLMEKKGLITREYSKVDTRLKRVILTSKAIELEEKLRIKAMELEENFKESLTDEEQETLLELLYKMKTALE